MKKIILIIFCLFFLFSCYDELPKWCNQTDMENLKSEKWTESNFYSCNWKIYINIYKKTFMQYNNRFVKHNSNFKSSKILSRFVLVDKNNAYFNFNKIDWVDLDTFVVIDDLFQKDKNWVYFLWTLIPEIDTKTFEKKDFLLENKDLSNYDSKDLLKIQIYSDKNKTYVTIFDWSLPNYLNKFNQLQAFSKDFKFFKIIYFTNDFRKIYFKDKNNLYFLDFDKFEEEKVVENNFINKNLDSWYLDKIESNIYKNFLSRKNIYWYQQIFDGYKSEEIDISDFDWEVGNIWKGLFSIYDWEKYDIIYLYHRFKWYDWVLIWRYDKIPSIKILEYWKILVWENLFIDWYNLWKLNENFDINKIIFEPDFFINEKHYYFIYDWNIYFNWEKIWIQNWKFKAFDNSRYLYQDEKYIYNLWKIIWNSNNFVLISWNFFKNNEFVFFRKSIDFPLEKFENWIVDVPSFWLIEKWLYWDNFWNNYNDLWEKIKK